MNLIDDDRSRSRDRRREGEEKPKQKTSMIRWMEWHAGYNSAKITPRFEPNVEWDPSGGRLEPASGERKVRVLAAVHSQTGTSNRGTR